MNYIIDDGDYRELFPVASNVNANNLRAVINLTQRTEMRDFLGDPLYFEYLNFIEQGSPESSPLSKLVDDVKLLHVLYVTKTMKQTGMSGAIVESTRVELDAVIGSIRSQELMTIRTIESIPEVYAITQRESINNVNTGGSSESPIYYPN